MIIKAAKIILFSFFLVTCNSYIIAQAENYYPFRIDVIPHADYMIAPNTSAGVGFEFEPKYNFTDHFTMGICIDKSIYTRLPFSDYQFGLTNLTSYGIAAEYFFSTNNARPFAGLSFKRYAYKSRASFENSINKDQYLYSYTADKWGIEPEIGICFPKIRFSISYNIPFFGSDMQVSEYHISANENIVVSHEKLHYNYLQFKIGITLSCQKRKNKHRT